MVKMEWRYVLAVFAVAFMATVRVSSGLECFRCVYDMRKPQGAKVWNAVRKAYETNDRDCFKPDRYNPPNHLVLSMQRCSGNGHCNKQLWQYRYSNDLYIARGCDSVCYNEVYDSVDYRSKGYDRQDVTYACCDDERCNGAGRAVMTSLTLTVVVVLARWFW